MERPTFIAFLRGINVGGHNVVKMERLRELFAEVGLANVRSYIQSGNVFFETAESDRQALGRRIQGHILGVLGFEVDVFLRTPDEVEAALALDPFRDIEVTAETRLFVIFTSEPLPADLRLAVSTATNDFEVLHVTAGEVFAVMRVVNDRPGNPAAVLEKTFKVRTTARFFGTLAKILEAARG